MVDQGKELVVREQGRRIGGRRRRLFCCMNVLCDVMFRRVMEPLRG